jgi:hypothetical protein
VATLARVSRAPAFPMSIGWAAGRLEGLVGEPLVPAPSASEDWERAWLGDYLACVDRWCERAPENIPVVGSHYEWLAPPRSTEGAGGLPAQGGAR